MQLSSALIAVLTGVLAGICLAAILIPALTRKSISGSIGSAITKIEGTGFTFDITLIVSPERRYKITGDKDVMRHLEVTTEGDALVFSRIHAATTGDRSVGNVSGGSVVVTGDNNVVSGARATHSSSRNVTPCGEVKLTIWGAFADTPVHKIVTSTLDMVLKP
ncbi:MAG: hypothetical protein PVI21_02900 [Candidatus Woesebacteria bacterium]|jgi:hypothetical protein